MSMQVNSITVPGVIINSTTGTAKLDFELAGSNLFKSLALTKFAEGTRLDLVFKLSRNQRQLIRAIEVKPTDRFRVVLVDFDESISADEVISLVRQVTKNPDWGINLEDDLHEGVVNVAEGLFHSDAYVMREELRAKANGKAIFEVVKHTADDMPAEANVGRSADTDIEFVGNWYIPEHLRPMFMVAANAFAKGKQINVLLTGPSGYGKTSIYEALAEYLGCDFLRVDCSQIQTTEDWFGYMRARGGDTIFEPTKFTEFVTRGRCVILLDEANRIEPNLANSLFPLLDHARATHVQGMDIKCGPSVVFGHTMNVGVKYAGTFVVDEAWKNRMLITDEVGPLPYEHEIEVVTRATGIEQTSAAKIVSIMNELRRVCTSQLLDVDVSTRTSLKVAELMSMGLSLRQAARYTIEQAAIPEERKAIVDVLNMRAGL